MAYAKYPDGDRYLLPLEVLVALGAGITVAAGASAVDRWLRAGWVRPAVGGLAGAALAGYFAIGLGTLAAATDLTRGGYVYYTLNNLDAVEPNAVVCSWWSSVWGWWYAQQVDGHRPDVLLVPKGPDECVRDVVPAEFGRRPVYVPALSEAVRTSDFAFFPSRDLWVGVGRRAPLADGALLKGPDDRIYVLEDDRRRWVPSMAVFTARGFDWDDVQLTPDYVLRTIPEGPPLA
jgi:hypothetical protein